MDNMLWILLILVVPLGIFFVWKSKKKKKEAGIAENQVGAGKKRKQDSETWTTIKTYLKSHGETGKEIIELFVIKRPDENDTSNLTKEQKKQHAINEKKKKEEAKELKKSDPQAAKENKKSKKNKNVQKDEQWILMFTTRNAKTKEVDEPRIIEANIEYVKKSKKETERVITVNDKIDFKKEMEWIKPLKDKEDEQEKKNREIQEKKDLKRKVKDTKKKEKKSSTTEENKTPEAGK
ncbi:MAG: DUF5385 family protein [Mycoplasma sp.]